jgi:hypothetical protein
LAERFRRDESCNARHRAIPRPPATNVHITVTSIPCEPETSPPQLPVDLIEYASVRRSLTLVSILALSLLCETRPKNF